MEPQEACMEVYRPPRVIPFAGELGFPGGLSADLLTGWNFTKADARIAIVIEVKVRRPRVLTLSPSVHLVVFIAKPELVEAA